MSSNKRHVVSFLVFFAISLVFWSQSRVPALNEKAVMGERVVVDSIAFDMLLVGDSDSGWAEQVFVSFVNWSYTNWKGMTFGLLLAAVGIVFFRLIPPTRSTNRFAHALRGLLGGIPLSICVNCATPVALGLHQAGVRMETVLGTLLSSPTFNFLVLPMTIALLPPHLVAIKFSIALLIILVAIPIIVARADRDTLAWESMGPLHSHLGSQNLDVAWSDDDNIGDETWRASVTWFWRAFRTSAYSIIRMTVPFMILAGLLGAIVIESLPVEGLESLPVNFAGVVLVSSIGVFLPVPIAFDVIICAVLLASGVPVPYVAALLITLGIFSIYPFMIIWRYVSRAMAISLATVVIFSGIVGAYATIGYSELRKTDALRAVDQFLTISQPASIAAVIGEYCEALSSESARDRCFDEAVFHQALNGSGSELCEALPIDRQTGCAVRIKTHLVTRAAVDGRNVDRCRELPDSMSQSSCTREVAFVRAVVELDPGVCDLVGNLRSSNQCYGQVAQQLARVLNSDDFCRDFPEQRRAECAATVMLVSMQMTSDISNCDSLTTAIGKRQCRTYIANRAVKETGSEEICARLPNDADRFACMGQYRKQEILKNGDLAYCDRAPNEKFRSECQYVVTLEKIKVLTNDLRNQSAIGWLTEEEDARLRVPEMTASSATEPVPKTVLRENDRLVITSVKHFATDLDDKLFLRYEGAEFGIDHCCDYSPLYNKDPFNHARGVSSGDFNNDGRTDLVFSVPDGIVVYRNIDGTKFAASIVRAPRLSLAGAIAVALVDINNDGWEDLFVTRFGRPSLFLINQRDDFASFGVIVLEDVQPPVIMAATFGDIDGDGDLDAVLGGWSYGSVRGFNPARSENYVLRNDFPKFSLDALPGPKGETLSVLLADFDNDDRLDLIVGNDGSTPDLFYIGSDDGFSLLPAHGPIPATPLNTMSVDVTDFDNNGLPDIFSVDMSITQPTFDAYCDSIQNPIWRESCEMRIDADLAARSGDIDNCLALQRDMRNQCIVSVVRDLAVEARDPDLCNGIPESFDLQKRYCMMLTTPADTLVGHAVEDFPPQEMVNKLLLANINGTFIDRTISMGVAQSYWSWNAKAADLDNDGWQDIYIGNGFGVGQSFRPINSNVFFHNQMGLQFERKEIEFGLDDLLNTPSYTYADIDNNGGLDVVATAVNGPVRLFMNNTRNPSIDIALRDQIGNRFGIGSTISVTLSNGDRLSRILKSGGGYLSFDAPVAHFGLGSHKQIESIEIRWSTGEAEIISGPFEARQLLTIERKK